MESVSDSDYSLQLQHWLGSPSRPLVSIYPSRGFDSHRPIHLIIRYWGVVQRQDAGT